MGKEISYLRLLQYVIIIYTWNWNSSTKPNWNSDYWLIKYYTIHYNSKTHLFCFTKSKCIKRFSSNGAQWQRKGFWYILGPLLYLLCFSIQLQKAKSLSLIPSYKYWKISIHYAKNCEFVNKILFKMLRIKIFRNNVISCFVQNSSYTLYIHHICQKVSNYIVISTALHCNNWEFICSQKLYICK